MATLRWLLDVAAPDAQKTFDAIGTRMAELDRNLRKTRDLTVGDRSAMATFAKLQAQADRFGDKLHGMPLTIEGAGRAEAQLLALEATADRLNEKLGDVGKVGILGRLRGLVPGGGGGAGGILRGVGGASGGLAGLLGAGGATPYLYGGLAGLAAALAPALLPVGLGGLFGGGAAFGALALGSKGAPLLQADRQALARARLAVAGSPGTPATASQLLALHQAQQKMARDQARYGEFAPLNRTFTGLGNTALGVFSSALEARGPGFSAGPRGQAGSPSFLQGLTGILKQVGGFIKTLGPQLGDLFRASLPFLKAFVDFLEKSGKTLLPVFTQALKQMTPYLPMIIKGLVSIVQGLAGMIKSLGPGGMKASAEIFLGLCKAMEAILPLVGKAASGLAETIMKVSHFIRTEWPHVVNAFRDALDWINSHFDQWRHGWAHIWDEVFNNTIGRVERGAHDIAHEFDVWRHNVAAIFDGFKHDVASVWDLIWNNTESREIHGIRDVVSWFEKLPGMVLGALRGLGHDLYAFGHAALTDLWDGMKAVGGSLVHWVTSFIGSLPGKLLSFLHMSPPHPGSAFYDVGANIMHHFEAGLQSRAHRVSAAIHGAVGGPAGGSAAAAAAYGRRLAAAYGWSGQWGDINAVAMRESGWSLIARNQSSGAYGIAQFINGPSEYYQYGGNPGTIAGQVTAFYNYIRQRYGSPAAAWAHEQAFGWYRTGFHGVVNRPTVFGAGEAGAERVDITPVGQRRGHGGSVVNFNGGIQIYNETDEAMVRQRLSFAIVQAALS